MFSEGSYCFDGGCADDQSAGCCFIPGGECKEVVSLQSCELVEGGIAYFAGASCDQVSGCSNSNPGPGPGDPAPTVSTPTMSEWGLIAMAGVLGFIEFMVIRRKNTTA